MMDVPPGPTAVASPLFVTVATEVVDEVQVESWVISWVDPSEYVPMSKNCWMAPTGMDSPTVTDDKLAEVPVSTAFPEKFPDVAVMIVGPTATAVAKPVWRPTVATDGLDEFQLTRVLISWVVPSE